MRTALLCTVGTSLLSNLARLNPANDEEEKLKNAYLSGDSERIAWALFDFDPSSFICGAEITTLFRLVQDKARFKIDPGSCFFMLSDTEQGRLTGAILKHYLCGAWEKLGFAAEPHVSLITVVGLQDAEPYRFKHHGLRNLIREMARAIRDSGGAENCAIDATGGYKAQIAIAVMLGQMMGIPVFYKHEKFNEIIDFPPLPADFDFSLYEEYFDLLYRLCKGDEVLDVEELAPYFINRAKGEEPKMEQLRNNADFQRFRVFLEEVEVASNRKKSVLFSASAAGNIYFESAQQRIGDHVWQHIDALLPDCQENERKAPHFTDDHFPLGFVEYVNRLYTKHKWIKHISTVDYEKQKGIRGNVFYIKKINGEKQLIGEYRDKNGFGGRFRIFLKEETDTLLHAAVWRLTEEAMV